EYMFPVLYVKRNKIQSFLCIIIAFEADAPAMVDIGIVSGHSCWGVCFRFLLHYQLFIIMFIVNVRYITSKSVAAIRSPDGTLFGPELKIVQQTLLVHKFEGRSKVVPGGIVKRFVHIAPFMGKLAGTFGKVQHGIRNGFRRNL